MAQTASQRTGRIEPAAESVYLQLKLDLAAAARRWRRRGDISPSELAERLGSSGVQTDWLTGDDSLMSLDLLVRSLLALGATRRDIALEIVRTG